MLIYENFKAERHDEEYNRKQNLLDCGVIFVVDFCFLLFLFLPLIIGEKRDPGCAVGLWKNQNSAFGILKCP